MYLQSKRITKSTLTIYNSNEKDTAISFAESTHSLTQGMRVTRQKVCGSHRSKGTGGGHLCEPGGDRTGTHPSVSTFTDRTDCWDKWGGG